MLKEPGIAGLVPRTDTPASADDWPAVAARAERNAALPTSGRAEAAVLWASPWTAGVAAVAAHRAVPTLCPSPSCRRSDSRSLGR
eukprot:scaffold124436_cov35-Tisochrysis_lutea.AAC.3